MSSSLCQGLQSCLEPRFVEPHILTHKLAPPNSNFFHSLPCPQKPNLSQNQEQEEYSYNEESNITKFVCNNGENQDNGSNLGGWSFLQALTNNSHNSKQGTETEQVYIHPLDQRSSCILSTKSLEMCTESLGSETGSDISESFDEFASMLLKKQNNHSIQQSKPRELTNKVNRSLNFPPPLTSISGSDGVQVRPHREGGRLVIKAVIVSSSSPYFQAHRTNDRLRLSFSKDSNLNFDNELVESIENICTKDSEEVIEHENADKVQELYYDNNADNDADDDGEGDGDGNCGCWEDDMKGNGGKIGCEVGVEDFPRPSRCKENRNENKGMGTWGTFWVAIS